MNEHERACPRPTALGAFGSHGISPIDGWETTAWQEDQRGSIDATGPGPTLSWPRICPTTWVSIVTVWPVVGVGVSRQCSQHVQLNVWVCACSQSSRGTLNIFRGCVLSVYMEHAHTHLPHMSLGLCKHIPSMWAPLWCLGGYAMSSTAEVPGGPVWLPECGGSLCKSM